MYISKLVSRASYPLGPLTLSPVSDRVAPWVAGRGSLGGRLGVEAGVPQGRGMNRREVQVSWDVWHMHMWVVSRQWQEVIEATDGDGSGRQSSEPGWLRCEVSLLSHGCFSTDTPETSSNARPKRTGKEDTER